MPTVPYDEAIKQMVDDNPEMGTEMFEAAINALLAGDVDEGRIHLGSYVKSTLGFAELARRIDKDPKNLMRMLSPRGNPTAVNLFEIVSACTASQGFTVTAQVTRPKSPAPSPAV
jgi:DNA-binding phage protein